MLDTRPVRPERAERNLLLLTMLSPEPESMDTENCAPNENQRRGVKRKRPTKKEPFKPVQQEDFEEDEYPIENMEQMDVEGAYQARFPFIAEDPKPTDLPVYEGEMSEDPNVFSRQCRICFKIFASRDKLRKHATAHQDEPEAYCGVCKAPIKYKYNLKLHLYKCLEDRRQAFDPKRLNEAYPGVLDQIELAARDLSVPFPTLEGLPYKMDKNGLVTGFDINLDIEMDKMAGKENEKFNVKDLIGKVLNKK
uniref:C2H2-type domain-containing protein n=2 Tax=Caenorhabditis tropicalis TaxID=1561998 RepID=A0A1I7UIH5_9PELO